MKTDPVESNCLILGASGFLGSYLAAAIEGSLLHTTSNEEKMFHIKSNFQSHRDIQVLFTQSHFKFLFNTIALTNIELCEANSDYAFWLNSDVPKILADECYKRNIKFVHFSTDAVFDGSKSMYKEIDKPIPKSVYGKSKMIGEQNALSVNDKSLILRVNFFGLARKKSLFNLFYEAGTNQNRVKGFTDVFFTTLYAGDLVKITKELVNKNFMGLYHVVGSERLSKYHFGELVFNEFGFDIDLLSPSLLEDEIRLRGDLRSLELSLSNDKLLHTGIKVPTIQESIKNIKKEVEKIDKK